MEPERQDLTVYVLAALPRDAELTCEHLARAGITAKCTASYDELLGLLDGDIGVLLVTEEAVPASRWHQLAAKLAAQPSWGDIPVIPTMSTGATDGHYLRSAGIPTYGVSGLFSLPGESNAHGRDEKMRVRSFYDGQRFLYELVKRLGGSTRT